MDKRAEDRMKRRSEEESRFREVWGAAFDSQISGMEVSLVPGLLREVWAAKERVVNYIASRCGASSLITPTITVGPHEGEIQIYVTLVDGTGDTIAHPEWIALEPVAGEEAVAGDVVRPRGTEGGWADQA